MAEYIPIILPALLGYGTAMFFKVGGKAGSNVSFRPPPVVFSLVWPILYIMLGVSWYFARKSNQLWADIFYIGLISLLNLWIIIYSQNDKKNAIYVLVLSIVFALLSYTVADFTGKLLIVPLIGWLMFATLLNIFEFQLNNSA